MGRPRILLAEDHAAMAEQLKRILSEEFEVVSTVGNGRELVLSAGAFKPEVIVTDIAMPELDGLAAAERIMQADPSARVVFVTIYNEPTLIERARKMNAMGYVLKLAAGDELVPAVWDALNGKKHFCACSSGGTR